MKDLLLILYIIWSTFQAKTHMLTWSFVTLMKMLKTGIPATKQQVTKIENATSQHGLSQIIN